VAESGLAGRERLLQAGQRQPFELCKEPEQLGDRNRGCGAQLFGERVIGHVTDSERIADAVQAHPALVRAVPLMDLPVSVVGGVVRDALLGITDNEDIDLVVEGDALALARRVGHDLNARVVGHGRFGTAIVELPHERWIDIAMARRERYPSPGALPIVEPGSLVDDLSRRDFTINAMAYRLTGPAAGKLVDPLGGRADLQAGIVRMLHPASFVEDPTRLLRAVRYAARLGFVLDPATEDAARSAAGSVDITATRVGDELRRLLSESSPIAAAAVAHAAVLGVPWLTADRQALAHRFAAIDASLAMPGAPRLEVWALRMGVAVSAPAARHAAVDGWARGTAGEVTHAPELAARLQLAERPSQLDSVLATAKPATVVVAHADGVSAIADWWATLRDTRLAISGEDLVGAGVAPGPAIGRGLTAARAALLDREVGGDAPAQLAIALAAAQGAE
jgi:tRNA nucleotidyltransferase (CCA-adding enzyme)